MRDDFGDKDKANEYLDAYSKISSSLTKMYDKKRETYASVRFTGVKSEDNRSLSERSGEKLYLWDTTVPFGILWGYPDHEKISKSVNFFENNTIKFGGGVQYFEAKDNAWLSGYGSGAFFFTTAALSEYFSMRNEREMAKKHLDWLVKNANSYGSMPERIYPDESDCAPASPLSWCSGEFALSVLKFSDTNK